MGFISNWLRKRFPGLFVEDRPMPVDTKLKEDKNTLKTDAPFMAQNDTVKPETKKRVVSEETRAKLSAASKAAHARRKEQAAVAAAEKTAKAAKKPAVKKPVKKAPVKKSTVKKAAKK